MGTARAVAVRVSTLAVVIGLAGCSPLIGLFVRATQSDGGPIRPGQTVSGDTRGAPDRWAPNCGAHQASGDRAYVFVPEVSGTYAIDLNGGYDCVLGVFDEQGAPIGCNDDTDGTSHSHVEMRFEAGRRYTLVADGYNGREGSFTLAVTPMALDDDQGWLPERELLAGQRGEGDLRGGADHRTPPCGATPGTPDEVWTFAPTESGVFVIDMDSEFDGVLAIYRRGDPNPIECNDDHQSTRTSRVSPSLTAGERYEIVVDGYRGQTGRYGVTIRPPTSTSVNPGGIALVLDQAASGTTLGGPDQVTPSCGARAGSGERHHTFTAPEAGTYRFHVDANYDSLLAVYAGGAELACNDDFGSTRASRLEVGLSAGQTVEVVVDGWSGGQGDYTLTVSRVGSAAPQPPAGPEDTAALEARCGGALPLSSGLLSGGFTAQNAHAVPGCGGGSGSDEVYRVEVQVPSTLRVTATSSLGPTLELRVGCASGARAVACAPPSGQRSTLEAPLDPGQVYFLVVDASQPGSGEFTLETRITRRGARAL